MILESVIRQVGMCVVCFFVGLVLDYADTGHKVAVEQRDATTASLASVAMYLLGVLVTWAAVDVSGLLVVPTAIGLVVGTHAALRYTRKKDAARGIDTPE